MSEVTALRAWLAQQCDIQNELAMSCRGLLEISFSANVLILVERMRLKERLRALVESTASPSHGTPDRP